MARLLEQAIDELEALDEQRERSRALLAGAAGSLVRWAGQDSKARAQWASADADDIERAMVLRSLNYIESATILKLSESDRETIAAATEVARAPLLQTTLASLYPPARRGSCTSAHNLPTVTDICSDLR